MLHNYEIAYFETQDIRQDIDILEREIIDLNTAVAAEEEVEAPSGRGHRSVRVPTRYR